MNTPILTHDLAVTRKIVLERLENYRAKVYLFGSQATGKARMHSDIDVAILPLQPLPVGTLAEICDALEESDVVRNVDVVDVTEADEVFRQRVKKEGIVWKE
jgi:predicted nucleotidyltransferase